MSDLNKPKTMHFVFLSKASPSPNHNPLKELIHNTALEVQKIAQQIQTKNDHAANVLESLVLLDDLFENLIMAVCAYLERTGNPHNEVWAGILDILKDMTENQREYEQELLPVAERLRRSANFIGYFAGLVAKATAVENDLRPTFSPIMDEAPNKNKCKPTQ